jgi:HD-GYP domain-containing protein (c-di-GMP phosphodiesterase class II)
VRLQGLIERLQLPEGGYVSVLDATTGEIICHPGLQSGAELRRVRPTKEILRRATTARSRTDGTSSIRIGLPNGWHYVTFHYLPELNALLVLDQPEAGTAAAVAAIERPLWLFGGTVAVIVVMAGMTSNALIVQRYESRLEQINQELEVLVERRSRALVNTRDAVIFGLAKLADSRDNETGEHLERIGEFVELLARQLARYRTDLDQKFVETLRITSSLHDIGKVGIPDGVLLKPGKLTPDERRTIEKHTVIGRDCLIAIRSRLGDDDFLDMACDIASSHHERWDGKGYPDGLSGEGIPIAARILAVADVYDALVSRRVYKEPMPHETAVDLILEGSGTQFDPEVVAAFSVCHREFQEVSRRRSKEKALAQVQEVSAVPPNLDLPPVNAPVVNSPT